MYLDNGNDPILIFSINVLKGTRCANAALIYSFLKRKKENITSENKEFLPCSIDEIERELFISYKSQQTSIKKLVDNGFIEKKLMGLPRQRYFKIKSSIR